MVYVTLRHFVIMCILGDMWNNEINAGYGNSDPDRLSTQWALHQNVMRRCL